LPNLREFGRNLHKKRGGSPQKVRTEGNFHRKVIEELEEMLYYLLEFAGKGKKPAGFQSIRMDNEAQTKASIPL